ncbi:MAG: hypothetical protein JWN14_1874, partial [Chthonomonadales bacterium]|nr:hypothetical protein [Chthonomonadales bacterium]
MMKSVLRTAAAIAILSLGVVEANAQVLYSTAGGNYSQNFDTLLTTPENTDTPWTDNSTLTGWYSTRANYRPSTGNSNT